jgi:hypothetical protein
VDETLYLRGLTERMDKLIECQRRSIAALEELVDYHRQDVALDRKPRLQVVRGGLADKTEEV